MLDGRWYATSWFDWNPNSKTDHLLQEVAEVTAHDLQKEDLLNVIDVAEEVIDGLVIVIDAVVEVMEVVDLLLEMISVVGLVLHLPEEGMVIIAVVVAAGIVAEDGR